MGGKIIDRIESRLDLRRSRRVFFVEYDKKSFQTYIISTTVAILQSVLE